MKNPDLQLTTAATGGKTHARNGGLATAIGGQPSGTIPTYPVNEMLDHDKRPKDETVSNKRC